MPVVHAVCCGIDVHQARLTACLRQADTTGQVTQDVREFATTYGALLALLDWLVEAHCPIVALESTGVYWKPVYHVLVGTVEVVIGQAQEMPQRSERKMDKADARWIVELLAHGLIQARTQAKNRVAKGLEGTHITRASVVADLFGMSGRQMLAALIAGERNPQALAGQFTDHHAQLFALGLDLIDVLTRQIATLDQQISGLVEPLAPQMEQRRATV